MFDAIGSWVTRRGWLLLVAWALVAAGLYRIAPAWETVSRDDDVRFFPAGYPSVIGQELLERGFPENAATSEAVFVYRQSRGLLGEVDRTYLADLSRRLRELGADDPSLKIRKVTDYREPILGPRLIGGDGTLGKGQAALTVVSLDATHLSKRARLTVDRLMKAMPEFRAGLPEGARLEVTGSAVVGHDSNTAANESIAATTTATIVLVVAILILIYRSPLLALIPLLTIALSVWVSMKGIAALTLVPGLNFQVINVTNVFVVVVLFGAGTDYCLFLIARYREELVRGLPRGEALREAIRQVGGALVASAGTVIIGLGMLYFSTFTKIQFTGPSIALSLAIALVASLTIAPVLLYWFRRAVFWPFAMPHHTPGADPEAEWQAEIPMSGLWARVADLVVRYPGTILTISLLATLPFAYVGARTRPNFSQLEDLGPEQPSVIGSALIRDYFPVGELGRTTVLIDAPKVDFRSDAGRQAIAGLSRALAKVPALVEVRSATQPLGKEPVTLLDRLGLRVILSQSDPRYIALGDAVKEADRGHISRIDLVLRSDPFSVESFDILETIRGVVAEYAADGPLAGARIGYAGVTPQIEDLRRVITIDERRMYVLVTIGVYLILLILIRRPLICLYLIATVILGYLASLGMTELVFQALHRGPDPWVGLDWKVSFFLFVILVAVGEDYNIFLMSRVIEEEAKHGPIEGTRRAVAHTGGIISSCGVIMAGTFGSMLTGRLTTLRELGFALGLGVLLDTFLVRPILVPAFLVLWHRMRPSERLDSPIGIPIPHATANGRLSRNGRHSATSGYDDAPRTKSVPAGPLALFGESAGKGGR